MEIELEVLVEGESELSLDVGRGLEMDLESGAVAVMPAGAAYGGPYEVTPTLSGFGMGTDGLFMTDDVTVRPIPVSETSNPFGGYTVLIG